MFKIKKEYTTWFKKNIHSIIITILIIINIVSWTNIVSAISQIGTGSVNGQASFNSIINWNDTFPGSASGTISNIVVTAKILPELNMTLSTGSIDLGILVPNVISSGSIEIEIWTNAGNWVLITASSSSWGLTNISNNSIQINNMWLDGSAEVYKFESKANANDSSVAWFNSTGDLNAIQVNDSYKYKIYQTNRPELNDPTVKDVVFKVSTQINSETAAWDYQDIITFTVTGNF